MYPSIRTPVRVSPEEHAAPARTRQWWRVGSNVYLLGLTSMITDISSEMVVSILPLYLIFQLGFSPFQFGLFNGIYQASLGLIAIASAVLADRRRRYKEMAAIGYGLSDACKLGMLAVGTAPLAASTLLLADRAGKGIRTSPRDALISLSVTTDRLATAFGIHRAMDTAGALLGPVVAYLILDAAPAAYDAVFVTSFLIGLVGLAVLTLFVENRTALSPPPFMDAPSPRSIPKLLALPAVRHIAIVAALFGLITFGDAFVYYTLQQRADFVSSYFPLLYVGTALGYLVLAVPLGRLADRWGRARVFLGGYVALTAAYALLLVPSPTAATFVGVLGLLGVFYAATDGVLSALVSSVVPESLRTTGIALTATILAIARLVASTVFGASWSWWGPDRTISGFVVATIVAIVVSTRLLLSQERTPA